MQVSIHGVERSYVRDFTDAETRTSSKGPFVAVHLEDGKGNDIVFILKDSRDVFRITEAMSEAMELLGISEASLA